MWRRYTFLCGVVAALALAFATASAQAGPLFITFTFDDGTDTQYAHRDVFNDAGMDVTFHVNSGNVGSGPYMTWTELNQLEAEGHEVGGHTVDHHNLTTRTTSDARAQICDDRTTLIANGIDARNFAYPFGAQNSTIQGLVRDCGYDTARTTGGMDFPPDCCVFSNPLSIDRPFAVRALQPTFNVDLEDNREVIERARDYGGGWLPFVFHDVCSLPCRGVGPGDYYVSRELLEDLVDWIASDPDLRVRTTAHMVTVSGDATAPSATLTAPADRAALTQGTLRLEASASDAVGVDRVEFVVDGNVVGTDRTAPYSVDWDASRHGSTAAIYARALDEKGNAGRSATAEVTIRSGDTTPPAVGLTAPLSNANVSGMVGLHATASDDSGITRVDWLANGNVVASDTTSPYEASWDTAGLLGTSPTIVARAYDGNGNHATTTTRTVNVVRPANTTAPVSRAVSREGTLVAGWIPLEVDTTGSANTIQYVEFFIDDVSIGIDWNPSFEEWWNASTATGATASFVTRVVDVYGNHTDSTPLVLTIDR